MKKMAMILIGLFFIFGNKFNFFTIQSWAKEVNISVIDFGAVGTDTEDDSGAFQNALDCADEKDGNLIVTIPKGTYYLDKTIYIKSNTTIYATGATIIARFIDSAGEGSMIRDFHWKNCGKTCSHEGYGHEENLTIIGGCWDRNSQLFSEDTGNNNSIFRFRHCNGIAVKEAIFKNGSNHFLNFSASRNVMIDGCTFENQIAPTTANEEFWGSWEQGDRGRFGSMEVIHLDSATKEGESTAYPLDNTVPRDVTIKNCTFRDLFTALGNHHKLTGDQASNVLIENNIFENIEFRSVYLTSFKDVEIKDNIGTAQQFFTDMRYSSNISIEGNQIDDTYQGVRVRDCVCSIKNNYFSMTKVSDGDKNGIYIYEGSTATVDGNEILNAQTSGIRAKESQVTILNNTIKNAANGAIYLEYSDNKDVIENNIISNCEKYGIYMTKSSLIDILNNQVDGDATGIETHNCSTLLIQGNSSASKLNHGIYIKDTSSVEMNHNVFDGDICGMKAYSCDDLYIKTNTCTSRSDSAMRLGGTEEKLSNGALVDSNFALSSEGNYDIYFDQYCSQCEVINNTVGEKGVGSKCKLLRNENNGMENRIKCSNVAVAGEATEQAILLSPYALGGKLHFKSSDKKILVDETGTVLIPKYYSGKFIIKITAGGKGYQEVSKDVTILVKSSPTSFTSLKKTAKGTFTAKWKKNSYADGYELQYSRSSKWKGSTVKTVKITKKTTVSKIIKKLKNKKIYYVRVRTYKKIDGKLYRSKWTKAKKVKV